MPVIIDIKMPEKCYDCKISVLLNPEELKCPVLEKVFDKFISRRLEGCPLREVKQ